MHQQVNKTWLQGELEVKSCYLAPFSNGNNVTTEWRAYRSISIGIATSGNARSIPGRRGRVGNTEPVPGWRWLREDMSRAGPLVSEVFCQFRTRVIISAACLLFALKSEGFIVCLLFEVVVKGLFNIVSPYINVIEMWFVILCNCSLIYVFFCSFVNDLRDSSNCYWILKHLLFFCYQV